MGRVRRTCCLGPTGLLSLIQRQWVVSQAGPMRREQNRASILLQEAARAAVRLPRPIAPRSSCRLIDDLSSPSRPTN